MWKQLFPFWTYTQNRSIFFKIWSCACIRTCDVTVLDYFNSNQAEVFRAHKDWVMGMGMLRSVWQKMCLHTWVQYDGLLLFQIESGWGFYRSQVWGDGAGDSKICSKTCGIDEQTPVLITHALRGVFTDFSVGLRQEPRVVVRSHVINRSPQVAPSET